MVFSFSRGVFFFSSFSRTETQRWTSSPSISFLLLEAFISWFMSSEFTQFFTLWRLKALPSVPCTVLRFKFLDSWDWQMFPGQSWFLFTLTIQVFCFVVLFPLNMRPPPHFSQCLGHTTVYLNGYLLYFICYSILYVFYSKDFSEYPAQLIARRGLF